LKWVDILDVALLNYRPLQVKKTLWMPKRTVVGLFLIVRRL